MFNCLTFLHVLITFKIVLVAFTIRVPSCHLTNDSEKFQRVTQFLFNQPIFHIKMPQLNLKLLGTVGVEIYMTASLSASWQS